MTTELAVVVAIMSMAGFVRGAFGFADALLAMPLLVLVMPVTAAAPLMAMIALLIALVILGREWRALEFRSTAVLIMFGLAGIPMGVRALDVVDASVVKTILGVVVILFSTWSLWKPDGFRLQTSRTAPVFGLLAGILGGAYNTSGPPLVIYAALQRWPVEKFRAMMQAYCLFSSTMILAAHGLRGHITAQTFEQFLWSAPFSVAMTLVGLRVTRRLRQAHFIRLVHFILILLGVNLIASSW